MARVALGRNHGCAIRRDDTLVCWGDNGAGQLGDGTVVDRAQPVAVRGLATVREVAVGAAHTCAP